VILQIVRLNINQVRLKFILKSTMLKPDYLHVNYKAGQFSFEVRLKLVLI